MKKYLFFIVLSFMLLPGKSQIVFCPPGAEWHYSFRPFFGGGNENMPIRYIGNSVVNGKACKVLSEAQCFFYSCYTEKTYIRQGGDTVFMLNSATQNNWQVLFNFACQPGQFWTNSLKDEYNITYQSGTMVDSVKLVNINNFTLKRMFVTQNSAAGSFHYVVTERIGFETFFFPFKRDDGLCDGFFFQNVLCYQDSAFGVKQFSNYACDFRDVGLEENAIDYGISIYPNPAQQIFTLHFDNPGLAGQSLLSVADITGRELRQIQLPGKENEINLNGLSNGVYIISLKKEGQLLYKIKLIKQE